MAANPAIPGSTAQLAAAGPAFLFQPEALLIYNLLSSSRDKTRKVWNEHYPERELERIANAFGVSLD